MEDLHRCSFQIKCPHGDVDADVAAELKIFAVDVVVVHLKSLKPVDEIGAADVAGTTFPCEQNFVVVKSRGWFVS